MGIDLHLSTCVDTQSPKYLEMAQGHISLSGGAKSVALGSSKPPPAAKLAAPGPSKSSAGAKAAASGAGKLPSAEPTKERRLPSSARTDVAATRVADFDTDICVGDYLVGKFFLTGTRS
jgi:hypothetical protein